jgi:hypothetical protein
MDDWHLGDDLEDDDWQLLRSSQRPEEEDDESAYLGCTSRTVLATANRPTKFTSAVRVK